MIIHPKAPQEYNPRKRLGYMHIYTGEGKGKTSAALGMLLRAAGHGHKVVMIQFLKGDTDAGELKSVSKLGDHVGIMQFGRADLDSLERLQAIDGYLANQALEYARELMQKNRPDVLILDEITTAIHHQLITLEDVLDFLDNRHQSTEVVLTGRHAHPALLNMADLVTIMESTKHYFDYDSFQPRLGIEQ